MSASPDSEVLITLDIDWAPDKLVDHAIKLLNDYGIKATLFLTGRTSVDLTGHEIGLHPNYVGSDLRAPIADLLDMFPGAIGVRSHSLYFSYRLVEIYKQLGIRYQSNVMAYKQSGLRAFQISKHVAEVPIYFMDNIRLMMEPRRTQFDDLELALDVPGLKVFDFHPIHLYLNTERIERYNEAKRFYQDPNQLEKMRNQDKAGTRDQFIHLLRTLKERRVASRSMTDWIDQEFRWTYL